MAAKDRYVLVTDRDRVYGNRTYRTPTTLGRDQAKQNKRRVRDGEGHVVLRPARVTKDGSFFQLTDAEEFERHAACVREICGE